MSDFGRLSRSNLVPSASDHAQLRSLEREIAKWLKPVLSYLPEAHAQVLDLHFGVTGDQVPPDILAGILDLDADHYLRLLVRLLGNAQAISLEHMLNSSAAA